MAKKSKKVEDRPCGEKRPWCVAYKAPGKDEVALSCHETPYLAGKAIDRLYKKHPGKYTFLESPLNAPLSPRRVLSRLRVRMCGPFKKGHIYI